MKKFYSGVIKYRYVIMVLFLIATLFCGYSRNLIKVDYDMNDYLPETSPSTVSIYILLSQMYKDFAQFFFFIKLILFFNFCDIMLYYKNSHGQNEVNQVKKKTLVPLITFLLGICLISLIVYKTDTHEKEQRHITAQLNVATYGEQIKNEITNGIEITDTLK